MHGFSCQQKYVHNEQGPSLGCVRLPFHIRGIGSYTAVHSMSFIPFTSVIACCNEFYTFIVQAVLNEKPTEG